MAAEQQSVTQWLILQYPNGRDHERAVKVQRELRPGDELTVVGRSWRVNHVLPPDRHRVVPGLVCTPVDALSPLARIAENLR